MTRAPARPGKPGTYGVVAIKGRRYYDLGFSTYYPVQGKAGRGKKGGPAEEDLYTYHAEVTRVVDGDSFYAHIALGFGIVLEARLRLRALNADELPTRAGIRAKKALEGLLTGRRKQVLIKTAKSDQYGRYLADVWVGGKDITTELLQAGLTLR
ncbi:MAG: thermonuclease family protein [Candidatus Omnitrophota bacterium]|nr:thermonuclease family protein [Candidatus Omnitrophota bacterium]